MNSETIFIENQQEQLYLVQQQQTVDTVTIDENCINGTEFVFFEDEFLKNSMMMFPTNNNNNIINDNIIINSNESVTFNSNSNSFVFPCQDQEIIFSNCYQVPPDLTSLFEVTSTTSSNSSSTSSTPTVSTPTTTTPTLSPNVVKQNTKKRSSASVTNETKKTKKVTTTKKQKTQDEEYSVMLSRDELLQLSSEEFDKLTETKNFRPEEEKQMRSKIKNRECASKLRKQKEVKISDLETELFLLQKDHQKQQLHMQGLETENENLKNQVKNLMEQLNSRINFDQLQFGGWNKLDFGGLNRLDFARFLEILNAFNNILKSHNSTKKTDATSTTSTTSSSNIFSKLNGIVYSSSCNNPLLNKQSNPNFEFEVNMSKTIFVSSNSEQQLVNATNEMKKLGGDNSAAINSCSTRLLEVVKCHVYAFLLRNYVEELTRVDDKNILNVLNRVGQFWALSNMLDTNWSGFFSHDQLEMVRHQSEVLLDLLRPEAVTLVDAFDFPDHVLNSVIGRYDGNVYESLFESAVTSELNKREPFDGYDEYLRPHLDKEFLKRPNVFGSDPKL